MLEQATNQIELEQEFNKNYLLNSLKNEFNIDPIKEILNDFEIPISFGINVLTQICLFNTCNVPTLVGLCKGNKSAQETADLLVKCAEADLIDYVDNNPDPRFKFFKCVLLPKNKELLNKIKEAIYPLPIINKPKRIYKNNQTGYLTYESHVMSGHRINRHNKDVCLDHINRVNKIPLCLNINVIAFMKNKWRNNSNDPDIIKKRNKALELFTNKSNDVFATMLIHNNKFYFNHKYDFRGRTYAQGYHINYMGNEYQKSCVELVNKELISN